MRRVFVVLSLLTLPAVAAAAQPRVKPQSGGRPPSTTATRQGPDVFGGFSYTHAGQANLKGWHLSGAVPFGGRLFGSSVRIAADLSGHYGSFAGADLSQLTFLAGPRLAWTGHRLSPFAQVLAGGARTRTSIKTPQALSASTTSWGGAFGAGADYRLTRHWAARAMADLLLLHGQGVWDTNPRLSLGVVYRFGH
jgi:opacity protein-like surface antigen